MMLMVVVMMIVDDGNHYDDNEDSYYREATKCDDGRDFVANVHSIIPSFDIM